MKLALACVAALTACHRSEAPRPAPRDAGELARARDAAALEIDAPAWPRYSIDFPATAQARETTVPTPNGPMPQKIETAQRDGTTYMVVSGAMPAGLPDGNKPGGQDRVLAMFGAKATRDVAIKLADVDGREVRFAGSANGILHTYSLGGWMIQAAVVARSGQIDEARAKRFFDSLQIHR